MERDMLFFKHNAIEKGLCQQYTEMWDCASDKESLVRMATDSNGASYMCRSIENGWGLTSKYIKDYFKEYCNGKEIKQDGYYSAMLCGLNGSEYHSKVTILFIVGCKNTIVHLDTAISEVYICEDSDVELIPSNNCRADVLLYGESKCNQHTGLNIIKM